MIASSTKLTPSLDVVYTRLDNGEAVLLHLGANQYFSLNETGALIWEWMTEGLTVEEMAQKLEAGYDVTLERALASVEQLVNDLTSGDLAQLSS